MHAFANIDALILAALFAISAAVHFWGPAFVQEAYARWGFPGKFYRVSAVINLLAALFLTEPITRVWGVMLGGLVTFAAVVLLLSRGRFATSLPGMLVLAALVPAILAGPIPG
ncbi:MAG TPA: DoxX family protein [Rhizomicrobium sp.]|nr:DoxX family protein [Rhizomicrobium sp.]